MNPSGACPRDAREVACSTLAEVDAATLAGGIERVQAPEPGADAPQSGMLPHRLLRRCESGCELRNDVAEPRVREHDGRRKARARRERLHRDLRLPARAEARRGVARDSQHEVARALAQAVTPVGDAALERRHLGMRKSERARRRGDRARDSRSCRRSLMPPGSASRQLRQPATARTAYAR